jgi:hypothetical protein
MDHGGERTDAGRPKGARDNAPRLSHDRATPDQKLSFTETALDYAFEALQTLVNVMRNSDNHAARVSAAGKILDRALGKAPQHVDVAAIKHTEIVYRSGAEIRQALLDRGVPAALLDRPLSSESTDDFDD